MSDTIVPTAAFGLPILREAGTQPASQGPAGATLVDRLLYEQQQLTAVERFSQAHFTTQTPDQSKYYSKLLPASPPGPGQQYAFEVDLDRCSGCKACVTACHSLNGLDDRESWRDVGLLIGGTESAPVMQHVTTACHHCIEPGCLSACPVDAYEKDPVTGIVHHLDDQCFGCQYCTLACPYDVPKYHAGKGIVRKCDMCSSRLQQGEAPACVQACPHEAIAIRVVDISRVIENSESDNFLPAAPEPYLTLPTTTYKSKRVFPRNTLPADYYSISPQHPHWPLIVMLVLTQLSVGAFITGCVIDRWLAPELSTLLRPVLATGALVLGLLALCASTLHLGRPLYAFRGLIGLRHSWLSREILAFGLFAGLAVPYAANCWLASLPAVSRWTGFQSISPALRSLDLAVAVMGALGVFCSVMIYAFTKREFWSFERTMVRFTLTTALLGIATAWLSLAVMQLVGEVATGRLLTAALAVPLAQALICVAALKLLFDLSLLRHLATFRNTALKRSARLVIGPLARMSAARVACGFVGGILLPVLLLESSVSPPSLAGAIGVGVVWLCCLLGELQERYLFFAAVSSSRMPGSIRP